MINGVQPSKHENGLSSGGEASRFEEIIQLANHSSTSSGGREKSETDIPDEPIVAFDGGNSFLKKAGPMKPQHVAGEITDISAATESSADRQSYKKDQSVYVYFDNKALVF